MNPLPIYIPFLTEKVSFFVHFPFKMVSLKKSLFFASRVKCTVPPFFLFLNSMNRKKKTKKKDIFSAFCILILPFGSFSQPFIYTFDIKIHYPPTYLKPQLPLSGGASCRIRYLYHRELPGRSAGVNFTQGCASPRARCFIFHDSVQDCSSMGCSYNLMIFQLKISAHARISRPDIPK